MSHLTGECLPSGHKLNANKWFQEFKNDDVFKHFVDDKYFDAKTSAMMHGVTINEQMMKITSGIELLNNELHSLVSDKYEDLLAQATKIETLEDVLKVIHGKIETLLSIIERLKAKVVEPYERISNQMILLSRLQTTCDLLRKIIRIIHLSKWLQQSKLDEHEATSFQRELMKAAQYINEIESIVSEDEVLKSIEVIQNDILVVKQVKVDVVKQANDMLLSGLNKQDQTQVATSLQVFYSLKTLNARIEQILKEKQSFILKSVKEAVDVSSFNQNKSGTGPGRVVIQMSLVQNASFRASLWNNIDSLLEQIYIAFTEISLIYKIIKKKRDPVTHNCFIDDVKCVDGLNEFWSFIIKSLSEHLCKAANDSIALKEALEGEYPKLLNSFSELWKRISRDDKEMNAEKMLRSSIQPFESAYLSRSWSLLHDSVNRVFIDAKESAMTSSLGGGNVTSAPTNEDIDAIVKTISNELLVSNIDSQLNKSVARNVGKTINLFIEKCERLSSVDGDSTQVIGPLTLSQLLNATLVHRLDSFRNQMKNLLASSTCTSDAMKTIEDKLMEVGTLMLNIINPMMSSVKDAIEAIILTMHGEDYSSTGNSDAQCSLYMRELQGFIGRVSNDYFTQFPECDVIKESIHKVANRTIDLFLRHSTLIRPISNYGKMKIAADFAQLEMAICPLCNRIGDLGKSYRTLRTFKPLLFQDAESISKCSAIGDIIPYSLCLQYIISCFAPNELKSPHEYKNWSLSRYTKWLDEHETEGERLELIKVTMESYVKQVRQQQDKSFAPVYPILLQLLQKSMQHSLKEE